MNINATILGQCISFIFFISFCMRYVWPPLIKAIENRQKNIYDNLQFIEQAKKKLNVDKIKMEEHIQKSKVIAQEIIDQANKNKIKIINIAILEAKKIKKRMIIQAQIEIDIKYKLAYHELHKKISYLAVSSAEKIIEQSLDKSMHIKIINKIISEL